MFTREAITTPWVDGLESENTEANSLEKPLTIIRPRTHVIHVEQGTNAEFPKARQMSWAQQSCSLRIFRLKLDGSGKTGDERRESSGAIRPLLVGFSSCRKPHVRANKKWCTLIRKSNLTPSFCKHNVNLISFSPSRFFISLFLLCGLRTSRWIIPKLFFRAHPLLCSSVVSITDSQLCIWGSNPTDNLLFYGILSILWTKLVNFVVNSTNQWKFLWNGEF